MLESVQYVKSYKWKWSCPHYEDDKDDDDKDDDDDEADDVAWTEAMQRDHAPPLVGTRYIRGDLHNNITVIQRVWSNWSND